MKARGQAEPTWTRPKDDKQYSMNSRLSSIAGVEVSVGAPNSAGIPQHQHDRYGHSQVPPTGRAAYRGLALRARYRAWTVFPRIAWCKQEQASLQQQSD